MLDLRCKHLERNIVLIETYWNVNLKKAFEKTEPKIVLIETYWNVNKTSSRLPKPSLLY